MNTTTYTPTALRREAVSAIRQYGRQRKVRVKLMNWSLEIGPSPMGDSPNFPTLLAHGWAGSGRDLDDAFTVRVAI